MAPPTSSPFSPVSSKMLLLIVLSFIFFCLSLLLFSLRRRRLTTTITNTTTLHHEPIILESTPTTHLPRSLLLEIFPSSHLSNGSGAEEDVDRVIDSGGEDCACGSKKKKKKRSKKNKPDSNKPELDIGGPKEEQEKQQLVCLYPFTSSSSATQRRIKQHYDQLVKSHHSNGLTLFQVGQFVNCLIEARNELQHKSEVIQRKFTISKALLFKADRSSFDRLRQQIYKLETEQKRLEEDAFVYNWLQQQLKLSPAYKKMLQISARQELKAKSGKLMKNTDNELPDISFEELLAQEKKDSFWQKNGKPRSCLG